MSVEEKAKLGKGPGKRFECDQCGQYWYTRSGICPHCQREEYQATLRNDFFSRDEEVRELRAENERLKEDLEISDRLADQVESALARYREALERIMCHRACPCTETQVCGIHIEAEEALQKGGSDD